jgi:hypothetical protein
MTRLSAILAEASPGYMALKGKTLAHWCPGCDSLHVINVEKPNHCNALWTWDGNVEQPTFSPSINIVGVCHYFIKAGQIEFCSDSRHALAGQTVPLPELTEDML